MESNVLTFLHEKHVRRRSERIKAEKSFKVKLQDQADFRVLFFK